MCGIVGYSGSRDAAQVLLIGLKRLEYRGYDSAGVALSWNQKNFEIVKKEGRLSNTADLVAPLSVHHGKASIGIGHTRWATHGKPTTQNAHPHRTGKIILVHNGIIENYRELKAELIDRGYRPASETDSELFGFLVQEALKTTKSLRDAVSAAFKRVEGACSIVLVSEDHPGEMVGVRNGSPLVAAVDRQGGFLMASDAYAILDCSNEVYYLENGDLVYGDSQGLKFFDIASGKSVTRKSTTIDFSPEKMDKNGYPHYMLKEIYEQPTAILDTWNSLLDRTKDSGFSWVDQPALELLKKAKAWTFVACGTSYHAAMLAKYWIEEFAGVPVQVELGSEYRYRKPVEAEGSVVVGISQSGETADTLAVVRDANLRGIPTIALTNGRQSTLAREAKATIYTSCGPEIGVAATKTLMAQLTVLFAMSQLKNPDPRIAEDFIRVPHELARWLEQEDLQKAIFEAAKMGDTAKGFFFIGRGYNYPLSLEGALKLKEIAYRHAEGYAAGELKHGPIAMIDPTMMVITLCPHDRWREKTISNLEEVRARGGMIISVGTEGDQQLDELSSLMIKIPKTEDYLQPFFVLPVLQRLSYEIALRAGTDIDKPRNLAKSVTVE